MINFNSDITNLHLDSLNSLTENYIKESNRFALKDISKETDSATNTSISEQSSSLLNELMEEEDLLSLKMNKAQTIYDTLADIRLKLRDLIQIIKDPDMIFDMDSLEQMDSMSNMLIDNVIDTIKNNDNMNIVNNKFLDIYIEGLGSIKNLNFLDNNFLNKLQSINNNIKIQENEYLKATEDLYSEYINISKKYDELVNNQSISDKDINKQIISNVEQTFASTATRITPDSVIRLLQ